MSTTIPGTSELVRLVDDGWRAFRASVRHIGRAQVHAADWVVAVVTGATSGHYAEHTTELA